MTPGHQPESELAWREGRLTLALLLTVSVAAPVRASGSASAPSKEAPAVDVVAPGREAGPERPLLASLGIAQPGGIGPSLPGPMPRGEGGLERRLRDPYVLPALESAALHVAVMNWNRHVGAAPWADVTPRAVGRNLGSSWVLDDNAYFVNQLGHPYQGTFAYTAARSAGLGFWTSTAYPFAASAAWEVAGETERPALNDQVTTTVAGVVLGEILYRVSGWVRGDGRNPWRQATSSLLAPMTTLNRALGTGAVAEQPTSVSVEARVGVLGAPGAIASTQGRVLGRPAPVAAVRVRQGLPGDPDFSFDRPFDHFDLEAAMAPSDQTYLSLRARGLVAGEELGGDGEGAGLWGLWLGFDLESPGVRRVSTSTVGLGVTGRRAVADGIELEGTAIGSAVLIGAAGVVERPAGSDKDYRMGPGTQATMELGLDLGTRFRAGVEARHVLIFGAGDQAGSDQLLEGRLSGLVRLAGQHGLRVEAGRFLRLAREANGPDVRQGGTLVEVSWVFGSGIGRFGTERGATAL